MGSSTSRRSKPAVWRSGRSGSTSPPPSRRSRNSAGRPPRARRARGGCAGTGGCRDRGVARYAQNMAPDRRGTRTVAGTRPRLGTGLSTNEDGPAAARAALDAALAPLGGDPADLVLLFISPQHEDVQRAI